MRVAVIGIFVAGFVTILSQAHSGELDGLNALKKRDYEAALEIWRPLASRGSYLAQFGLGYLFDNGFGVPVNVVEAVKWYRLSAE